jgi:CRP/FNR family transcriptional regulator, cyclic AMP receptor protein
MTADPERKIVDEVAAHPFFHGLDRGFISAICSKAVEHRFGVEEMLAFEGTSAEILYVVLEGKVALEIGAADRPRLTVQTVGPGEVLGWSWLVPPHHWRFDARALKPTRAIALDGGVLRHTMSSHPAWGYQFMVRFMPILAERLENTRIQLLDIHGR